MGRNENVIFDPAPMTATRAMILLFVASELLLLLWMVAVGVYRLSELIF